MNCRTFTSRVRERMTGALDLPSLYTAVVLREHRNAFAHAKEIAADQGAGTLVWVRRFDTVEFALVLEPEEPLREARRALYAAMNAMGDALAAHCPPEKPLVFAWPDTIMLDAGILGGARLGWPPATPEHAVPDWLVVGLTIRMAVPHGRPQATGGSVLDVRVDKGTSLEIEGFEMMDAAGLINSFTRHFMVQFDLWQEKGFVPVGQQFLGRLPEQAGTRRGIDTNGDLLVRNLKAGPQADRSDLLAALDQPQWLDPATEEPWL